MDKREASLAGNDGVLSVHEKNLFVGNHVKVVGNAEGGGDYTRGSSDNLQLRDFLDSTMNESSFRHRLFQNLSLGYFRYDTRP